MKILFLDDDKERHKRFLQNRIGQDITAVWNYDEAVDKLNKQVFDVAHLDHDLSYSASIGVVPEGEKTGTDVAEFIAQMSEEMRPRAVVIHSFNHYGAKRMETILKNAGVSVTLSIFKG